MPADPQESREVTIGVICLDTAYPKIVGHIRNPVTFEFPIRYRVVPGATASMVTGSEPPSAAPFIQAARELEAQGVAAVTTGCGFLAAHQRELADAVGVPCYASSLIQLPLVHRMLRSDQRVGVLVARKRTLTRRHLQGVGAEHVPVCVVGMDDQPEFREVIIEARRDDLDADRLGHVVLVQVELLAREYPAVGALVIECTDLAPYAPAVRRRFGLPVFDIVTLTEMVHRGLARRRYG